MKTVSVVCFFALVAFASARPDDRYTDKWDNINMKEILENKQLLKGYIDCILERGKCTPDAKDLKGHLVEGIQNSCAKCTEKQKKGTTMVIEHLINKEPAYWKELSDKFDPEGVYYKQYEKKIKGA